MEIKNIVTWKSSETKTIQITHGFGDVRYTLELREFLPLPGDMLHEAWWNGNELVKHPIPPFAIVDMNKAATELKRYVNSAVVPFMVGKLGDSDPLIWETYEMAFKHAHNSEVRALLRLFHLDG